MFDGIFFLQGGQVVDGDGLALDRSPDLVPRHMLVTGIGRGGTTACAQIMAKLGFETESPTPYQESKPLRQFILNGDAEGALETLARWPATGQRMFWKDPKIWTPGFDPFLERLPPSFGLMVVFRDPLNIAARNSAWASEDLYKSLQRAATMTFRLAERMPIIRDRNVALVSYEKLVTRPGPVVAAIARFLQIEDQAKVQAATAVVEPTPDSYQAHFRPL